MEIGDVRWITTGHCEDLAMVDTGMFGVSQHGCVYFVDADRPAIVETGTGAEVERILAGLDVIGLEPTDIEYIVVTHVHLDHAGGAGRLADVCENASVVVSDRGAPHLVDPERLIAGTKAAVGDQWRHYASPIPVPASRIHAISPEETIDLGNRSLVAHPAPGHARHQLVFAMPSLDAVFTGDAAGLWHPDAETVLPTSPPPEFDLDQARADVDRILALEPSTLLYTHFGPASDPDTLLPMYKSTLAEWVDLVKQTYELTGDKDETVRRLVEETGYVACWGDEKGRAEVRLNVNGVLTAMERESK